MQFTTVNEFIKSELGLPNDFGKDYTDSVPHPTDLTRGGMWITEEAFLYLDSSTQNKCISVDDAKTQGWFPSIGDGPHGNQDSTESSIPFIGRSVP